jgi:RNA polymerase sigma-B factor
VVEGRTGRTTRDDIIASNLHLCSRAARRFERPGMERGDLQQVAAIALIKAADRYDRSRNVPFEAFAWITILGELMNFVRDHECIVRIPRSLREQHNRYSAVREQLAGDLEREPSDAECSNCLGVPVHIVRHVRATQELRFISHLDCAGEDLRNLAYDPAADCEDAILVRDAFAGLSLMERRVLAGLYLVRLPASRLARYLGLEPRQVATLRRTALLRMRSALDSSEIDADIA